MQVLVLLLTFKDRIIANAFITTYFKLIFICVKKNCFSVKDVSIIFSLKSLIISKALVKKLTDIEGITFYHLTLIACVIKYRDFFYLMLFFWIRVIHFKNGLNI